MKFLSEVRVSGGPSGWCGVLCLEGQGEGRVHKDYDWLGHCGHANNAGGLGRPR